MKWDIVMGRMILVKLIFKKYKALEEVSRTETEFLLIVTIWVGYL
jgi:hypothetical protein